MLRRSRLMTCCLLLMTGVAVFVCPTGLSAQNKNAAKKKSALPTREGLSKSVTMVGVNSTKRRDAVVSARMIDKLINADLARQKIEPNPKATDEQFVRRAYLTITGTIPMSAQAESFCSRTTADRDQVLIDQLLGSPAHASHQYNCWADTLRLVDVVPADNHMEPYQEWIKDCLRDNKPYNQMVKEMLTAEGHVWDDPAAGYLLRDIGMPLDSLNNTVRVFLGTQIGCAQCHNHPFDRWTQKEFYQLAAFTAGSEYRKVINQDLNLIMSERTPKTKAPAGWFYENIDFESTEGRVARSILRANRFVFADNEKNQLKFPKDYAYKDAKPNELATPAVIFGKMPDLKGKTRRQAFAEWLTSNDNPRFARTIANRLWKQVFGRGLIEPVDDMKDDTVASNPELMTFLEEEMKRLNYDLREFMRVLYYTETFRRQVTYADLSPDQPYHFPGPVLRRMSSEQVWDSLLTLTVEKPVYSFEFTDEFAKAVNLDHVKSIQDILDQVKNYQAYQKTVSTERAKAMYKGQELLPASELRQPLPDGHFLRQFGQSNREQIDDSTLDGTVPQLMVMFNGAVTHMMLEDGSVIYKRVVAKKRLEDQIDSMFWSILSRSPTASEKALALNEMKQHGPSGYGNVIWALLNTREFLFVQ